MSDRDTTSPSLLRGLQLKDLGRFPEAEKAFKEALSLNAYDAFALHQLAVCQFRQPGRAAEALATIRAAIAIEPREAGHFAVEAFIHCALKRPREALESALKALNIDPTSGLAFTARAQAHLQLENWAAAEAAARHALGLDSDNSLAANQLAQALRLQNKAAENARHLAGMLSRDPEDAFTHANAGWAALQNGRRRDAEVHFREALRLDPSLHSAREGLLNSFRARSAFYRAYLKYSFWMQRLGSGSRWAVILGLYACGQLSKVFTGRYAVVGIVIECVYFVLVLWVWIARGMGNFILLFDSFVRHALYRNEKIEAIAVGGGVCAGLALFGIGVWLDRFMPVVAGAALVAAAFPFSLTFTNPSRIGSWIFGSVGVATLLAAALFLVQAVWQFLPEKIALDIFLVSLVACLASTWLGNVRALRS